MSQEVEDEKRLAKLGLKDAERRAEEWQDLALEALAALERLQSLVSPKPTSYSSPEKPDYDQPRQFLARLGDVSTKLVAALKDRTFIHAGHRATALTLCAEDVEKGATVLWTTKESTLSQQKQTKPNDAEEKDEPTLVALVEWDPETLANDRIRFVARQPKDCTALDTNSSSSVFLGQITKMDEKEEEGEGGSKTVVCTIAPVSAGHLRSAAAAGALAIAEQIMLRDKAKEVERLLRLERERLEEEKRRLADEEARILHSVSFID